MRDILWSLSGSVGAKSPQKRGHCCLTPIDTLYIYKDIWLITRYQSSYKVQVYLEPVTGSEIQGTGLEGRIFCSAPSIRQCRCKSRTPWPGWECYHQCQPWTIKKIPTDFLWEEGVETNKQTRLIPCGLLVRTTDFCAKGSRFESNQEPTTCGKSYGSSTLTSRLWNEPLNRKPPWGEIV